MLNEIVKQYFELKQKEDEIKAEKESLKEIIVREMKAQGQTSLLTEDGIFAKITPTVTFKYLDEPGIMTWLEKNGLEKYIKRTIDTRALNAQLKTSAMLNEGLNTMYRKNTSESLKIEKVAETISNI